MMTGALPLPQAPVQFYLGEEWTVGKLMTVFRRRRTLFGTSIVLMLLLGVGYCCVATRRYKATGKIQVEKEASGAFGLESSVMGPDGNEMSSDSLDYNITLQTESEILQSDALALHVIEAMKLEGTHDYFPQHPEATVGVWMGRVLGKMLFWNKSLEPLSVELEGAPNRRYKALKIFASHLKVQPVIGTRLIEVSYSNPDARLAAGVVKCVFRELVQSNSEQRMEATAQASGYLEKQLGGLRDEMQRSQGAANLLQRVTGMFGDDASRNVVLDRLASLNQTLEVSVANRMLKEAIDHVAVESGPEFISSLSGNASMGSVAPVSTSQTLTQSLRAEEAALRQQLAEDAVRYGPAYPKIGELQAQLAGVQKSIAEEVLRVGGRAHTDYLIAAREEAAAMEAFAVQKAEAAKLNDAVVAYRVAKQEADSSRDLYETLRSKQKQWEVLAGMNVSNIAVVVPPQVPPPNYPSSPRIPLVLAGVLGAGTLLGGALVVLLELSDDKVRSLESVERSLGVGLMGMLPTIDQRGMLNKLRAGLRRRGGKRRGGSRSWSVPWLVARDKQSRAFTEGLRSLRTSLLLSTGERLPQVILITSGLQGEGKTTLAVHLGMLLSEGGSRVLLVDADLRKPAVWRYFDGEVVSGLGAALEGASVVEIRHPIESLPNLAVICGEEVPEFPAELLSSARMRSLVDGWRAEYDFIVLDCPPVLPVTDAVVLAGISDAVLLVARHGKTPQQAWKRSAARLREQHENLAVGAVLTDVARNSADFYEYFGYRGEFYGDHRMRDA